MSQTSSAENMGSTMVEESVGRDARITRLLRIMREIRSNPHQELGSMLEHLGISKSQFYKDKAALAEQGFSFFYRKTQGFVVEEDRLTPITGLSLSDRIVLMFALEHLNTSGDGLLAAQAVDVGRKLAGGLESPFREQLQECFDQEVTSKAYAVEPSVFQELSQCINEGRRVSILYQRSEDWSIRWRIVDPRRLYLRQRTLYLYARTVDETPPQWKVFRLNRIQKIERTGVCLPWRPGDDDGFAQRQSNAFMAFLGTESCTVKIRFSGKAVPFIRERQWHKSQVLTDEGEGRITLTVQVADAMEVVRWARQFGSDAEVLEPKAEFSA